MKFDCYNYLPVSLQNLLVSARGWQLKRLRYTDFTWKRFEFFEKSQWWSKQEVKDYQNERLTQIVRHAYDTVPLYKEKWDNAEIKPGDIKSLEDIRLLPILLKEEFRQNNHRAYSTIYPANKVWHSFTSGTTGTPLCARITHDNMRERFALFERFYQWYTPGRWRRRASFTGKLIVPVGRDTEHVSRINRPLNQWLFSSHHLHPELFKKYFNDLAGCRPRQIDGILSPIFVVAQAIRSASLTMDEPPNVVITTSETLWDYMRDVIGEAFHCKVANQYSSQEGIPIACECSQGGFHVCPESGFIEILNEKNEPCQTGEVGRMVVTSFLSDATPLIRYDIGDTGSLTDAGCVCGRFTQMFSGIYGRVDDMLYTEEMGVIPRVDSAFKGLPSCILATQVAQLSVDCFEVRLMVDEKVYKSEYADVIIGNLHKYLGNKVDISSRNVSGFVLSKSGKVKAMVNEIGPIVGKNGVVSKWNEYFK
ncbi:MAG: hypothetical protein V1913_17410 [Fibrobacterota bacterium]